MGVAKEIERLAAQKAPGERVASVEALMEKCGASVGTVIAGVQSAMAAGVPVVSRKGPKGGYFRSAGEAPTESRVTTSGNLRTTVGGWAVTVYEGGDRARLERVAPTDTQLVVESAYPGPARASVTVRLVSRRAEGLSGQRRVRNE